MREIFTHWLLKLRVDNGRLLVVTGVALFEDGEGRHTWDDGRTPQVHPQRPTFVRRRRSRHLSCRWCTRRCRGSLQWSGGASLSDGLQRVRARGGQLLGRWGCGDWSPWWRRPLCFDAASRRLPATAGIDADRRRYPVALWSVGRTSIRCSGFESAVGRSGSRLSRCDAVAASVRQRRLQRVQQPGTGRWTSCRSCGSDRSTVADWINDETGRADRDLNDNLPRSYSAAASDSRR